MNCIYIVLAFVVAFSQRSEAVPIAYLGGYSPYFHGYYPYGLASPVVHAAAPVYAPYLPYSAYTPLLHPHRELHNVAGAIQRENELLTDVSIRFPAKNAKTL